MWANGKSFSHFNERAYQKVSWLESYGLVKTYQTKSKIQHYLLSEKSFEIHGTGCFERLFTVGYFVFYQGSAPSLTTKFTICSQIKNKFLPHHQCLSNFLIVFHAIIFLWGYLKNQLNKGKVQHWEGSKT